MTNRFFHNIELIMSFRNCILTCNILILQYVKNNEEVTMINRNTGESIQRKPLRLWPGVVIVTVQWLLRFGLIAIMPEFLMIGVMGELICAFAIIVWWAFFSRAPRLERWGGIVLMIVILAVTHSLLHESMKLMPFVAYIIPVQSLTFVLWAVFSRRLTLRAGR